jgi:hypothetical protein
MCGFGARYNSEAWPRFPVLSVIRPASRMAGGVVDEIPGDLITVS